MSSSRNIAVLGLSVFIGLVVPTWAQSVPLPVNTGVFDTINYCCSLESYYLFS